MEIDILIPFYSELVNIYSNDQSLSMIESCNLEFPHFERMLDILRPWTVKLKTNSTMDRGRINEILSLLSQIKSNIATIHLLRNEFDMAESYCQQSLSHARLYEGEAEKTDLVYNALKSSYSLHADKQNYADALFFAEEAYNLVATSYNPVHRRTYRKLLEYSLIVSCTRATWMKQKFLHK
jgi:hypothetical protein